MSNKREYSSPVPFLAYRLADKLRRRKNIDCIYFTAYVKEKDTIERIYELTIVTSGELSDQTKQAIKEYSRKIRTFEDTFKLYDGVFKIVLDSKDNYATCAMEYGECRRVQNLYSATILLDKTGYYYKVAHQFDQYGTMYKYENIIDYNMKNTPVRGRNKDKKTR